MAKEFGMLPSQIEKRATTYDLMIIDVLNAYDNFQQQKTSGKIDPKVYQFKEEELLAMIEKTRVK